MEVRSSGNMARVAEYYQENPTSSQRAASLELGISRSSLQRMMSDLKLFPYKIQQFQELSQWDKDRRLRFATAIRQALASGRLDSDRIWFSDEAHFHLSGYVNKQNYRHWGTENPRIFRTSVQCPQRVTVWCAISSVGIIGPWFFSENVNRESYQEAIRDKFVPEAQGLEAYEGYWFQQDGATPHTTNENLELLDEHFHGRVIARNYQTRYGCGYEWPPNSPDLNPCDFYLWGKLKDRVYSTQPDNLTQLRARIQEEIEDISQAECSRVISNFKKRIEKVYEADGSHIEQYHM